MNELAGVSVVRNLNTNQLIAKQLHRSMHERKRVLSNKHPCFNCTGTRYKAADCKCRAICQVCQKGHHTSICDTLGEHLMTATSAGKTAVIHPVVVVKVQGVKCRALLDTG